MAIPLCRTTWQLKLLKQEPVLPIPVHSWCCDSIFPGMTKRDGAQRSLVTTKVIGNKGSSIKTFESRKGKDEEFDEGSVAKPEEPKRKLAEAWKEIHGQNDWVGMLDPIDPLLRAELLRYGDMAQACYDAYDFDPYSKFCGSCKVNPSMFFESLGWKQYGYEVTSYIYSTYNVKFSNFFSKSINPDGWSPSANWMGYVAVSNDEYSKYIGRRDITIAWRGTVTNVEKIADLMDFQNATAYHTIPSRDPTWCYFHIGVELPLDHQSSPFLKESSNLAYIHNLEVLQW